MLIRPAAEGDSDAIWDIIGPTIRTPRLGFVDALVMFRRV